MKTKFKIKKLAIMLAPITIIPVTLVACGTNASVGATENKTTQVQKVGEKDKNGIYILIDNQDAVFAKFDNWVEQAGTILKDLQNKYTPEKIAAESDIQTLKEWKKEANKKYSATYTNWISNINDTEVIMDKNYKQLPDSKDKVNTLNSIKKRADKWNLIGNNVRPEIGKIIDLIEERLKQLENKQ